jgi:hypothetical protein
MKAKSGHKTRRSKRPIRINREWIIGVATTPFRVQERGGFTPKAAIVLEYPLIIANQLFHPDDPIDWKKILEEALHSPLVGAPRSTKSSKIWPNVSHREILLTHRVA